MRTKKFAKNTNLEGLLLDLANDFAPSSSEIQSKYLNKSLSKPLIIIMAPMRSGTTLFMQWLASLRCFSYPTNLLSRFYYSPVLGSKIQELLTSETYSFRDELDDFIFNDQFVSQNGKTRSALSPNEFWYFWDRFIPHRNVDDFVTDWEIENTDILRAELAGMMDVFQKPFALKGMKYCMHMEKLTRAFPEAIFVRLRRDTYDCAVSTLKARELQKGSQDSWYSIKVPDYECLLSKTVEEQVITQIETINSKLDSVFGALPQSRKLEIYYEDFCESPREIYNLLSMKLKCMGESIPDYEGIEEFEQKVYERTNSALLSLISAK